MTGNALIAFLVHTNTCPDSPYVFSFPSPLSAARVQLLIREKYLWLARLVSDFIDEHYGYLHLTDEDVRTREGEKPNGT